MGKSGSTESQGASELIDNKIAEFGDWRGQALSRIRKLIQAPHGAYCMNRPNPAIRRAQAQYVLGPASHPHVRDPSRVLLDTWHARNRACRDVPRSSLAASKRLRVSEHAEAADCGDIPEAKPLQPQGHVP